MNFEIEALEAAMWNPEGSVSDPKCIFFTLRHTK